ncbi:MAG TPA: antibiotic biosynthesis monooxygenase [Pseudonocardiaceae bacterium]|jgi:heme-degrading monooxygenase HmoA|nr:antibiotic biosynthesis monooxygenase [Pseudonocardiaceae bacterium]
MTEPVLEVARLDVRPGQEAAFQEAFAQARSSIAASPGFLGLELRRCTETPNRYLLLVRWATIDDHTIGFRKGKNYGRWKELLHHFYDPFPEVEHYETVVLP